MKILIIDDNADIRISLRMALECYDFQIFEAADGEEGFSVLQKIIPDIILLDLMMPVMNGGRFAELLAQHKSFSRIPLIVLSAFTDKATKIKAHTFIRKPFEFNHLLDAINVILTKTEKA